MSVCQHSFVEFSSGLFAFGLLGLLFPGFFGPLAWVYMRIRLASVFGPNMSSFYIVGTRATLVVVTSIGTLRRASHPTD